MLRCELDVMDYMVTMETEELEVIADIEERFNNDYMELLNSDFYRLITGNIDADLYDLILEVLNEEDETIYRGIAGMYPYDWVDPKVLDYTTYNIGNDVHMTIWIESNKWK